MNRRHFAQIVLGFFVLLFSVPSSAQVVPEALPWQGRMRLDGALFSGDALFRYAIVTSSGGILWTNDGSGSIPPTAGVVRKVAGGVVSVALGEPATVGESMRPVPVAVFSQPKTYLRVWVAAPTTAQVEELVVDDLPVPHAQAFGSVPYSHRAAEAGHADIASSLAPSEPGQPVEIQGDLIVRGRITDGSSRVGAAFSPPTEKEDDDRGKRGRVTFDTVTTRHLIVTDSVSLPGGGVLTSTVTQVQTLIVTTSSTFTGPMSATGGIKVGTGTITIGGLNFGTPNSITFSGGAGTVETTGADSLLLNPNNAGFVGIGTLTPRALLHLRQATGDTALRLEQGPGFDGSWDWVVPDVGGAHSPVFLRGGFGPSPRLTVTPTGWIGINTLTPSATFHVEGTARVTGALRAESLSGDGSGLTALNAGALAAGTLPDARLSGSVARRDQANAFQGDVTVAPGARFIGDGGGLSNLTVAQAANVALTDRRNSFQQGQDIRDDVTLFTSDDPTRMRLGHGKFVSLGEHVLGVNAGLEGGGPPDTLVAPSWILNFKDVLRVFTRPAGSAATAYTRSLAIGGEQITMGTKAMQVDLVNESVGIGTTQVAPEATLHLVRTGLTQSVGIKLENPAVGNTSTGGVWHIQATPEVGGGEARLDMVVGGGAPRLAIKGQSGRVGIGTENPEDRLHILGGAVWEGDPLVVGADPTRMRVGHGAFSSLGEHVIGVNAGLGLGGPPDTLAAPSWILNFKDALRVFHRPAGSAAVAFTRPLAVAGDGVTLGVKTLHADLANERVGIGTTAPAQKLHLVAGGAVGIELENTTLGTGTGGVWHIRGGEPVAGGAGQFRVVDANGNTGIALVASGGIPGAGKMGIGTDNPQQALHVNGVVRAAAFETGGVADFKEPFRSGERLSIGDVVAMKPGDPGCVVKVSRRADPSVVGVVSSTGPVPAGFDVYVGILGRMRVRVAAENGPIEPGVLLIPWPGGRAARADDPPKPGTVIGKAMGTQTSGEGEIEVLLFLH